MQVVPLWYCRYATKWNAMGFFHISKNVYWKKRPKTCFIFGKFKNIYIYFFGPVPINDMKNRCKLIFPTFYYSDFNDIFLMKNNIFVAKLFFYWIYQIKKIIFFMNKLKKIIIAKLIHFVTEKIDNLTFDSIRITIHKKATKNNNKCFLFRSRGNSQYSCLGNNTEYIFWLWVCVQNSLRNY